LGRLLPVAGGRHLSLCSDDEERGHIDIDQPLPSLPLDLPIVHSPSPMIRRLFRAVSLVVELAPACGEAKRYLGVPSDRS